MALEHDPDIEAAERSVVVAKARLRSRIGTAVDSGGRLVRNTVAASKPALVVLAGAGVVALLAGAYKLLRPRRRANLWEAPRRPSVLGEMFRAAAVAAASRLTLLALGRIQPRPLLPPPPRRPPL